MRDAKMNFYDDDPRVVKRLDVTDGRHSERYVSLIFEVTSDTLFVDLVIDSSLVINAAIRRDTRAPVQIIWRGTFQSKRSRRGCMRVRIQPERPDSARLETALSCLDCTKFPASPGLNERLINRPACIRVYRVAPI